MSKKSEIIGLVIRLLLGTADLALATLLMMGLMANNIFDETKTIIWGVVLLLLFYTADEFLFFFRSIQQWKEMEQQKNQDDYHSAGQKYS